MLNRQTQYFAPIFNGDLYPYNFNLGEIVEIETGEISLTPVMAGTGGGLRRAKPSVEREISGCIQAANPYKCCITAIGNWRRSQPASKLQFICDAKEARYQDCLEQVDNPQGCEEEVYGRYPGDPTRQDCVAHREKWDREVGEKYDYYDQQCWKLYGNPAGGGGGGTTTA